MRTFSTYIEYLLMTRHYCYVPGKGAYMLAEEPAAVTHVPGTEKGSTLVFTAPRRTIKFSQLPHHDDGMLANLLMEAEGMSYDEACRYIERQVATLTDQVILDTAQHTDLDNFGFSDLRVDTWASIEQKKAWEAAGSNPTGKPAAADAAESLGRHQADTIAIPKYWIRRAAVILLIVVCFFANFLGLNDRVAENQLAAVLDTSFFQHDVLVHQSWDEDDEETDLESVDAYAEVLSAYEASSIQSSYLALTVEEDGIPSETPSADTQATPATPAATDEQPDPKKWNESLPIRSQNSELAMSQSPTGRLYYIIVASCSTEADANRALGNLRKAGYEDVGVLERDGRFRLYVNFFAHRGEADAYLTRVRSIERFHDAWLLPVREGSLSHIIKNTYNDNQLSMELSHLNQRTERDQG